MKKTLVPLFALAISSITASAISIGDAVTLGDASTRQAALESAIVGEGFVGPGNASAAVLNANVPFQAFGTWTERGEETDSGASGILDVTLTSGAWGSRQAGGTWEITDSGF